jgi:hypothetical protein
VTYLCRDSAHAGSNKVVKSAQDPIRTSSITKSSLSEPRRRLVEMMQGLNFGRIERLAVRRGEPVFDPAPRIIQDIKIGGENGPRPELAHDDFTLRSQVAELFEHLTRLGDGSVEIVEVKHGLPFRLVIEHSA